MKRNPSTLFAPGPGSDLGSAALVPMSPEILALYQACQRNAPWGTDVDDVLSADRLARGEPEQITHAQRLDPCDAMPSHPAERYRAYVSQRRYAVLAYFEAGKDPEDMGRCLGCRFTRSTTTWQPCACVTSGSRLRPSPSAHLQKSRACWTRDSHKASWLSGSGCPSKQ